MQGQDEVMTRATTQRPPLITWCTPSTLRSPMYITSPQSNESLSNLRPVHGGLGSTAGWWNLGVRVPRKQPHVGFQVSIEEQGFFVHDPPPTPSVEAPQKNKFLMFPIYRIDDLYLGPWGQERLGFFHLDVEGHEVAVLNGSMQILKRDRPILTTEVYSQSAAARSNAEKLFALLDELQYDSYVVEESCGTPSDCRNLINVPRERRDMHSATLASANASSAIVFVPDVPALHHRVTSPSKGQNKSLSRGRSVAVVTITNKDFEPCLLGMLKSLRGFEDFAGHLVTALDYQPPVALYTKLDKLNATAVVLQDTCGDTVFRLTQLKGLKPARFFKLAIFTCAWFRRFDLLAFMDADQKVRAPFLAPLFEALEARSEWILLQDNGPGVGKTDFFTMELHGGATSRVAATSQFYNFLNPGQTSLMFIKLHALPSPRVVEGELLKYHAMLGNESKHDDQSIILALFQRKLAVFPICSPTMLVLPNQTMPFHWGWKHCQCRGQLPYHSMRLAECKVMLFVEHDYAKKCLKETHM